MLKYSEYPEPPQPQDNHRGWWCIFGVSLVLVSQNSERKSFAKIRTDPVQFQIFNVSLIPTFGLLFEPLFQGSNETASIVMNLFLFLSNLTILATGYLTKDLSAKNFVFIGSVLTSLGLFLSAFVSTFEQLIFTFPVMVGIGLGLLNPAAFVAVLACFTCHRTYAISIVFAALGLGQMLMPMVVDQIIADFGQQEGLIMLSILSIMGVVGANFLVPITWRPCRRASLANYLEQHPLLPRKEERFSTFRDIVRGADLDLMFNFRYITIIMGLSIVFASSSNLNIVFPVYLVSGAFGCR